MSSVTWPPGEYSGAGVDAAGYGTGVEETY